MALLTYLIFFHSQENLSSYATNFEENRLMLPIVSVEFGRRSKPVKSGYRVIRPLFLESCKKIVVNFIRC